MSSPILRFRIAIATTPGACLLSETENGAARSRVEGKAVKMSHRSGTNENAVSCVFELPYLCVASRSPKI